MNSNFIDLLRVFTLNQEELKNYISSGDKVVKYYGLDSEGEGYVEAELALICLYLAACDVIGFSDEIQEILDEMYWLCGLSKSFFNQSKFEWLLGDINYGSFWLVMNRYSRIVIKELGLEAVPPVRGFHSFLEYYDFPVDLTPKN